MAKKPSKPKRKETTKQISSSSKDEIITKASKKLDWVFIASSGICFIIFLLIRLKFMDIPLDRDEGSYLYTGWAWLQGEVPYVDFYEVKPPGLFAIYALFHLLFGYSKILIHIGLLLLIVHQAYLIYRISDLLGFGKNMAISAGLFFCFLTLNIATNAYGLMSEYFLLWFMLLSTYFTLRHQKSSKLQWLLLGGMALGFAAMVRQQAIFFLPIFPLLLLTHSERDTAQIVRRFLLFAAGALSVILIFALIILAYGSWDEMMYWIVERPSSSYTSVIDWDKGKETLGMMVSNIYDMTSSLIIAGLIGTVALVFIKISWWKKLLVYLAVAGGMMSIFPGYRFYGHYWILIFWGWSILSASTIGLIPRLIKEQKFAVILQSLLLLVICMTPLALQKKMLIDTSGRELVNMVYGQNPQEAVDVLSDYLKKEMSKEDQLFVFGSEPQAYYLNRKIAKSKHIFLGFIHKPGNINTKFQEQTVEYIKTEKPKYIMHVHNSFSIGFADDSEQLLYQWLYRHEQQNYLPIAYADIQNYKSIKYVYGKDARTYNPVTDNYIILYERQ